MSVRIKRAVSKSRFPLKQSLIQPSFKNATIIRGGKSGDKEVLACYVFHENELQDLVTWREIEFQGWTPFFTRKLLVHEPLVTWFNRHVQFLFDESEDNVENPEMFIMCGKRKFKFGFSEFDRDFGLKSVGFNDYHLRKFPADIPVSGYTKLNSLLNRDQNPPRRHKKIAHAWQG
ncbi:hypothetical protein LIER_03632 [Lithospermum erythrorhizon]|uniref:Uncharacterized protein n=1 Tax=Lithospermum erythrorhizon TaxID=34254 RepID=A0AAV3NVD2_LITER